MALKFVALAVIAGVALASIATAQTVDPNAAAAPSNAPLGTEQQLNMRHRGWLPPGEQPEPAYQHVCAWRSDGGPVTGPTMRLPLKVTIGTCAIDQSQHLHTRCRCDGHRGTVIEVPV